MCECITRSAEVADVLLPSFDDEVTHFGDTAPEDTVTRYRALGAATIVVKNGGGDVLVHSDGHAPVHVTPPKVMQVVDSTAAGDAFNAGFLARWMQKVPLREAAEVGCNVSAQVIRQRGALTKLSV
jgi:2-dehydro-3-deoxygluconokinase